MLENFKYVSKISTTILFFTSIIIIFLLFFRRGSCDFRVNFLIRIFPDFYQHISNFCISYLSFSGIGYFWLFLGIKLKVIIFIGLMIILANFVYELWIPFLNTNDLLDAYYGTWGTIMGLLFLLYIKYYGLNIAKM